MFLCVAAATSSLLLLVVAATVRLSNLLQSDFSDYLFAEATRSVDVQIRFFKLMMSATISNSPPWVDALKQLRSVHKERARSRFRFSFFLVYAGTGEQAIFASVWKSWLGRCEPSDSLASSCPLFSVLQL